MDFPPKTYTITIEAYGQTEQFVGYVPGGHHRPKLMDPAHEADLPRDLGERLFEILDDMHAQRAPTAEAV